METSVPGINSLYIANIIIGTPKIIQGFLLPIEVLVESPNCPKMGSVITSVNLAIKSKFAII